MDAFLTEAKDLLRLRYVTPVSSSAADENQTVEEGSSTQPMHLDPPLPKLIKVGEGESSIIWRGVLQSGQMIGIKELGYCPSYVSSLL